MVPKKTGLPNSSSWRRRARAASASICSLDDIVIVGVGSREDGSPRPRRSTVLSLSLVLESQQWAEGEGGGLLLCGSVEGCVVSQNFFSQEFLQRRSW